MATFTQLTADQQAQLAAFMPILRGTVVQYVKALNQVAALDLLWQDTVSPINTLLDAGAGIPDTTGLDGATQLTHDDLIAFMADVEQVLAAKNDAGHRAFYARAAGLRNTTQTS